MSINISGVDKVKLLAILWHGQIKAGYFAANFKNAPGFDKEGAVKAVTGYIDYYCGRAIKTDLSKMRWIHGLMIEMQEKEHLQELWRLQNNKHSF